MPTTKKAPRARKFIPSKKIVLETQKILASTNWKQYWRDVSIHVEKEIEGYERARVRSLETASQHVFLNLSHTEFGLQEIEFPKPV